MFLYFLAILSKEFRLKHPDEDLFIGGKAWYPKWTSIEDASLFEEKKSSKDGQIIIVVKSDKDKVWDIEAP